MGSYPNLGSYFFDFGDRATDCTKKNGWGNAFFWGEMGEMSENVAILAAARRVYKLLLTTH